MNFHDKVQQIIAIKNSLLCVGLDSDIEKMPRALRASKNPLFDFNRAIIDATADYAAAFKVNLAFYEAHGVGGWQALHDTFSYLPSDVLKIADAKRGDIGNTAVMYARTVFDVLGADCVTVNPYMGFDSIEPFLMDETRGAFIICLTSNPGSHDFQYFSNGEQRLYERVAGMVNSWNRRKNCGLVVGATHADELAAVRRISPELPFLIPGIGAQGGDLVAAVRNGADAAGSLALFNSSRAIIYASGDDDFAQQAKEAAQATMMQLNEARFINE
ncbi:orotidine-5'-phosphate decarboxylase [candidate division KSB1 bacterium]|nr:orotidine-5'-phosphate decarboxylase [candidate division KSB1 bacterium]RQW03061.1 MAG: orotidine-5'-phosphate decarboxylase [candidate division KSB1 bacterium]